ncbi:hypothetical protein N9B73_01960 [Verrucomicrobiales bacterium]|nr:hypothetical protein [Verrucomicrobiales bacterium]
MENSIMIDGPVLGGADLQSAFTAHPFSGGTGVFADGIQFRSTPQALICRLDIFSGI